MMVDTNKNLKPFTGADDPRRGHPKKGSKHISTWIKNMLNDEEFETILFNASKGSVEYKGAPLKAIISVAILRAIHDKDGYKWAEWLAKHGYGSQLNIDIDADVKVASPIERILIDSGLREDVEKLKDKNARQDNGSVSEPLEDQT